MNVMRTLNPSDAITEAEASRRESAVMEQLARLQLRNGGHLLLEGPAGTGKTRLLTTEELNGRRAVRVQCQPGQSIFDLLGTIEIVDGSTRFAEGVPILAIERGWRLIFDEVDRLSDDGMSMLYALGDNDPFMLPNGREIIRHENFQLCACTNDDARQVLPEGPRDRFAIVPIHEPFPGALAALCEPMRESARRAVRNRITGLRAWYRFEDMLRYAGIAVDDALADCDDMGNATNGNGLPALIDREHLIGAIAVVCFGEADGPEILRAWRVAACRERGAPIASSFAQREMNSAAIGYAQGIEAGIAAGYVKAFDDFTTNNVDCDLIAHDHDDCDDCARMRERAESDGYDSAMEDHCCEHDHGARWCSECEDMINSAVESAEENYECCCEHDHDANDCYACESIADDERRDVLATVANALGVDVGEINELIGA